MGIRDWFGRSKPKPRAEERLVLPAPPTEADIMASLEAVARTTRAGNAPPVVTSRVMRIIGTIEQTLPRLRQMGLGSMDSYSVMATATDYLPEAVGSYLRLPRDWADTRPIDGYKTSLMLLVEQLDLLAATMDKIFDAANRADAQALIAHGEFLKAKFGVSDDLAAAGPLPTPDEPPVAPRSSLDL